MANLRNHLLYLLGQITVLSKYRWSSKVCLATLILGVGLITAFQFPASINAATTIGNVQTYSDPQYGITFLHDSNLTYQRWSPTLDILSSTSFYYPQVAADQERFPELTVTVYNNPQQLSLEKWLEPRLNPNLTQLTPDLATSAALFEHAGLPQKLTVEGKPAFVFSETLTLPFVVRGHVVIEYGKWIVKIGYVDFGKGELRQEFATIVSSLSLNSKTISTPKVDATLMNQLNQISQSYTFPTPSISSNPVRNTLYGYYLPWKDGATYSVSQGWNSNYSHTCPGSNCYAYDFAMGEGTEVVASKDGVAKFVTGGYSACGGSDLANAANRIVLYHNDGTATLYLHLQYQQVFVSNDQNVAQGTVIGKSGKTGWTSCGPHLHFQRQAQGSWFTQSQSIYFNEYENQELRVNNSYTSGNKPGAGDPFATCGILQPGVNGGYPTAYREALLRRGGIAAYGCPSSTVTFYAGNNTQATTWQLLQNGGSKGKGAIFHHEGGVDPASISAYVVGGGIYSYYINTMQGPNGALGYPTSDETSSSDGKFQVNFWKGYIRDEGNGNFTVGYWPQSCPTGNWLRDFRNVYVFESTGSTYKDCISGFNFSYDWGANSPTPLPTNPPASTVPAVRPDNFTAQFTRVENINAGRYILTLTADDNAELTMDDNILPLFKTQVSEQKWVGLLTGGTHTFKLRFREIGGDATLKFSLEAAPINMANTPRNMRITNATNGNISVTWDDMSDNETNFLVQRKDGNGNWQNLISVGPGVQTTTSGGLTNNVVYGFRVAAGVNEVYSAFSNEVFGVLEFSVGQGSSRQNRFIEAFNRNGGLKLMGTPSSSTFFPIQATGNSFVAQWFTGYNVKLYHNEGGENDAGVAPGTCKAFAVPANINHIYYYTGDSARYGAATSDSYFYNGFQGQAFVGGYIQMADVARIVLWNSLPKTDWVQEFWNNSALACGKAWQDNSTNLSFDYNWTNAQPRASILSNSDWSARFTRKQIFPAGDQTFNIGTSGGVRFYIDGSLKINQWSERTTYQTFTWNETLTAGEHELRLEYYDNNNNARLSFSTGGLIVTNNIDRGETLDGNVPGTLSYALVNATSGQIITFNLNNGSTISVKGILPPVKAGVIVRASCNSPVTIDGADPNAASNGIVLQGNITLQGLKLQGFRGKSLNLNGTKANRLICTSVKKP